MPDVNFSNWRKSSRSNGQNGNCVEVGFTADGAVTGVRDTKEASSPNRSTLAVGTAQWASFLGAVRSGTVDMPR